jgi:hypothetical protein
MTDESLAGFLPGTGNGYGYQTLASVIEREKQRDLRGW